MNRPILDPREGDLEDDASSTKKKTLVALAGTLLAEISLPKLVVAWMSLIGFPGLLLGAMPLALSIWVASLKSKTSAALTEYWPVLLLVPVVLLGWFLGRKLLRLAESSFWSLNALAIQPVYIFAREGLRHLAEAIFSGRPDDDTRTSLRAVSAAAAGLLLSAIALALVAIAWPATRWTATLAGRLGDAAASAAGPARQWHRVDCRLLRRRGPGLGRGRRVHDTTARPARIFTAARGIFGMAGRSSVGHSHGWGALRLQGRERPSGAEGK